MLGALISHTANAQIEQPQEQPVPSFETDILPIVVRHCSPCHTRPNMNLPQWVDYEVSFAYREKIYDRVVVQKNMPLGSPLDAETLDIVSRWVMGGAPQ